MAKPQIIETLDILLERNGSSTQQIIKKNDIEILASNFVANEENENFSYKIDINIPEITPNYIPTVVFNETDATSGNFSPVCYTSDGIITIFAKKPIDTTIPLIYLQIAEVVG